MIPPPSSKLGGHKTLTVKPQDGAHLQYLLELATISHVTPETGLEFHITFKFLISCILIHINSHFSQINQCRHPNIVHRQHIVNLGISNFENYVADLLAINTSAVGRYKCLAAKSTACVGYNSLLRVGSISGHRFQNTSMIRPTCR